MDIQRNKKMHSEINKLKKLGYKIYFETIGDELVEKIGNVCFISDKNDEGRLYAMGISICSLLETYSKKDGYARAFWRAKYALDHKVTTAPITDNREDWFGKYIVRSKKVKNIRSEDLKLITDTMSELLVWGYEKNNINLANYDIDSVIKIVDNKIIYKIPLTYCLSIMKNEYDWKCIYLDK